MLDEILLDVLFVMAAAFFFLALCKLVELVAFFLGNLFGG